MASGSETWDLPAMNFQNPNSGSFPFNNSSNVPVYNTSRMLNTPVGRVFTNPPPPVPARPARNNFSLGYNSPYNSSYSSPYNSYGGYSSGFGGFGGYGYGYGGYRPGFGSYGYGSNYYGNSYPESRFIQFAEESSRPAFQTIQSVLQAFGSVVMMFESSFNAIYSSYMSVLGVADNFGKLRSAFSQVFSMFAVIKSLNWIYRKLLSMLGINRDSFSKESIWSEALNEVSNGNPDNRSHKRKSWPMLLIMSIIIGGPYLLFKLMNEIYPHTVPETWVPAENPGSLAVGLYDFHAASDQELSFSAQQKLMIAPKKYQPTDCPGWVLACNESRNIGLIPNNYIGVMMQSSKTGQTYIEHNGQTYQHPVKSSSTPSQVDLAEKTEKTVSENKGFPSGKLEKINEVEEEEL